MSYPTSTNETFKVGDRVFAKIRGYQHWPAQVTERVGGPNEEYCVAFYGTHEIAYVKPPMMCHYDEESIEKYASPPVVGKKRKPSRSHVLMLQKAMEECASAVTFIPVDVNEQNNVGMEVDGLKERVLDEAESQVESPINESVTGEIFEKTLSPDTLISKRSRSVKSKAVNIVTKTQNDEKVQSVAVSEEYPDQEIIQNVQGNSTPRLVLEEEKASVMFELPRANLMLSELNDANNSKVSRSGRKIKLKRFADEVDSSPFAEQLKATLKSSQELSPKKRKSSLDENVQQAKKLSLDPEVAGKSDPGVKRQKSFSTDDQIKSPPVEPPLVFAKKSAPVLEENPIREPSSATSDITSDETPGRRPGRPSKNRFLTNVPNLPSPSQLPASISWKVEAMKPLQDKLITSCKRLESLHAKEGESAMSAPIREKLVAVSTPTAAVLSVALTPLPSLSGSISKSMDAIAKVIAGKSSKKIINNSPNSQNGSKSVVYGKKSSASIETQTLPSQIAHKTTEPENTPKLPPASPHASLAVQAEVKAKSSEENFEECLPQTNSEKKPSEIESKTIPGEAAEAMMEKVTNDSIVEQSNETVENKITDTASTTTTTTTPSIPVSFAGVKENGIAESPIRIKKQNKTPSRKVSPEKRTSATDSNRGKKYPPLELKQDPHSISKKPRLWTPEVKKEENFTGRTHLQRKIDLPKRYQETAVSLPMLISPSTEAAKTNATKKPESPVPKPKVARPALLANGTPGLKPTTEARMNGVIKKSPSKSERSRCSPSHDTYTAKGSTSEADDVDEPIDITESDFIDEKTKAKFMATSKEKEVMETVVDLIDSTLLNNHDCDTALSMINKLGSPNFVDKTILKSHPEIVEVLRKMQHFVGNPKGNRYNKAQKVELQEKSALIRVAAIKTLEDFKELMSTNTKPRAVLIMEEMRRQQQSNSEA